jgi:hypothetical protein
MVRPGQRLFNIKLFKAETPGISKFRDMELNTRRDKATVSVNHILRTVFYLKLYVRDNFHFGNSVNSERHLLVY